MLVINQIQLQQSNEYRVPKTDNQDKLEDFILLKSKNKKALYRYYAICGQSNYVLEFI